MDKVKELFEDNPSSIDGMNFTEFKRFAESLGIARVTVEKVLELFTPTEYEGIYYYENKRGDLIELSDPTQFEPNKVRKTRQYYFCVM